ncbi:malonyl-CoA synthase [Roseateles sp. BYS180W]|uniref:Malonyl-CoA synthase n=1 Tax=Roseateles rivi TaxID=3299028 RepID=A0ABW7FR56_9BURK
MDSANDNLFLALRQGFPEDLQACAIEVADAAAPLRYSWLDLERASAMLANWLEQLQLEPASRVLVQVDKSVEALTLYLAVLRAGHVYVPLNSAYQDAELAYFIEDAKPAVVVCAGRNFGWISKLAFTRGVPWVFTLNEDRSGTLLDRAQHMSDQHQVAHKRGSELAAILYTSGTTGRSKGAMLSHANLLSNAQVLKDLWAWRGEDVLIHALPIFHVHGLFVASHGALLAGARMLWVNRFDAATVLALLPRATVFMGVPTLYVRLLAERGLTPQHCAAMRLFISGSAPLLLETFRSWQERTGHTILERYGMSETLMLSSNPYDPQQRMGGTVGPALPGVGLRVVDDAGQPCAAEHIGHIQVRGPNVFSGYWCMPEKTAAEFSADGWFKTGDVGQLDAQGYLRIVGRSKDLIISGGYNVYPAEVEGFINELPGVAESAVIGAPHPDFGEAVVAVVVAQAGATPDAAQMLATLKQRIAGFKVPKQLLLVPELPRNAMGKVQKNLLRQQYQDLFA